ncbi:hypothetical protein CAI21_10695 [Alkalilimnicola ehrlichii]|uniref:AB hydrolase-1 domain-containing protein n=1 Tax=Alkalilimnicola ehrlichii TaxID=351052 RepID=A0A3E0WW31_9GAMM|nr:alpha/beta hydrolase [Alkalilimnicola ehrlichii]RFA29225.1 hypothetical protein CAI21_10695 [Alkalilimnicola ehrlichii]RFA36137.1 hypothetical protein CAL65_11845 [Alkalilimnicola ehrlichii]
MNYLLVPGAWAGEWVWNETASCLRKWGHTVHTITLSGLDGASTPSRTRLDTHVQDVLRYARREGLKQAVLVGHSYSGLVVGQAAALAPNLFLHSVFVEAFLPIDGQSLFDVSGLDPSHEKQLIAANSGLWPAPTVTELRQEPLLNTAHIEFLSTRFVGHPGLTVSEPAALAKPLSTLNATFIARPGWLAGSRELELIKALRQERSWTFKTVDGGHWPMITVPERLSELLHTVSEKQGVKDSGRRLALLHAQICLK